MADPLKTFFSEALVRRLAADLERAQASFPVEEFVRAASRRLEELELLDRARHIAHALGEHLPRSYADAIEILLRSLGPEHASDELLGAGMAPFFYLPHLIFVATQGLDDFELSFRAQHELTRRFSAEFSIRAFLAKDPERTLTQLHKWARDPSPHVRRLVSEGTRPRLPWATRVEWLEQNPGRVLELLEILKDDPAPLVRRSVANHLNDLGKAHPELLLRVCARWLGDASPERRALVEHALRSSVKRGETGALRLLGFGVRPAVKVAGARFEPERVPIGARVDIHFELRSTSRAPQAILVDAAVDFVKANGRTSRKVFKLKRLELPPRGKATLKLRVSLAQHTTRKPYPGQHRVALLANGVVHPVGAFEVVARRSQKRARRAGDPAARGAPRKKSSRRPEQKWRARPDSNGGPSA